jgi:hypothetical protein
MYYNNYPYYNNYFRRPYGYGHGGGYCPTCGHAHSWSHPALIGSQLSSINQSLLNYGVQTNVLQQAIANQALGYY